MVEVKEGEEARIGAPASEVIPKVHALEPAAQERGGQSAHPFVEISEHQLGSAHVPVGHNRRKALGLVAALEDRGPEMDVVDVERVAVDVDVRALQTPPFARLPREVVLDVVQNREAA